MIQLEALAAGRLLPLPPWTGRLVGLHSRSLSILHPEGFLVSIVAGEEAMEALAVRLGQEDLGRLKELLARSLGEDSLEAGAAGSRLRLPGLEIDYSRAPPWDSAPRIAAARAALRPPGAAAQLGEGLAYLAALLGTAAPEEGILGSGPFGRAFRELLGRPDYPASLLGFGPGTTPAGDDFIAGLLLAGELFGAGRARGAAYELSRTSPAGRSLLAQALAGSFPEPHARLAEGLAGWRPLETAARALLSHGASSGSDFLAGLLAGAAEAGLSAGREPGRAEMTGGGARNDV